MTNQERLVEGQEESVRDSLNAVKETMEEQTPPTQHDAVVEGQEEASSGIDAERTEPAPPTGETAVASASVETEATSESQQDDVSASEQAPVSDDAEVEQSAVDPQSEAVNVPTSSEENVPTENESQTAPDTVEDTVDALALVQIPTEVVETEATTSEQASEVAEALDAEDASYTSEEASEVVEALDAEGASYTPVDDDESGRPRRVKDLEPDMELDGRVTSIALYGIFVDIGVGRDGLVHISEMSDTRIESPSDLVRIGDTVKIRVKSVDPDGRRISLTMRSKERPEERKRPVKKKPEVDREALANLRVGDLVDGTVTGVAPFGIFVDIGVGKDGLVHISELSEGHIEKAEDAVQVGEVRTFKLLEIDAEGTRISLSLRRADRAQRLQGLETGQIINGTVSGLAPFGAFVDIGVGRDGLVHISELFYDRVSKVEDVIKVGDTVGVRVLDVDHQSKRISLTMRLEDRPEEEESGADTYQSDITEDPETEDTPTRRRSNVQDVNDEPEQEVNNATLEDLVSKYGGGSKRDRRRRKHDDYEEEEEEDYFTRRSQRDAIRRTLEQPEE
ncbi:MAG: 30S ribosomal protein S1 [Chloroflexi bacterium AL-W]|nr:30S ribosomal protein S1 [Chloroflexi bacterium AL-N1]NOK65057.1 30S ribosomal protein S1 [Chloroflexi bacterium AL-N10]NOK72676.1 30S ribosomal protein S1 [Chloroflexi bacterium AL-N5]NOK79236.1 30S ribosomal protein S1 [Chloroflexi bacterium AL-W]NOK87152.1 30S ribosomal protein S1 [Chloroflexi bacterium AL-N15]